MSSMIQNFKDKIGTALMNTGRPVELSVKDKIGTAIMSNSRSIDEKATKASEKISKVAARAKLEMSNTSSKISSSYLKAKNFTTEKFSALSEKISTIVKAVRDFFSLAVRKANKQLALDKLALEKSNDEFQNARNEQILGFTKNAGKFAKAVIGYENGISESTQNDTAKSKYERAVEAFAKDLASLDGKVSRKELLDIYKAAEPKNYTKIRANDRFGSDFKNINKSMTLGSFIDLILASETKAVRNAYKKEISGIASKFASALKEVKNIQDATNFNHNKFEAVSKLADNSEYKNVIGKDQKSIAKDLNAEMVKELGGKKVVEKLISKIESIISSPKLFNEGVEADINEIQGKVVAQLTSFDDSMKKLDERLQKLADQEAAFAKQNQDLLSSSREPTKQLNAERRKEVLQILAKIDEERKDIEAQKESIAEDIKDVKNQEPLILEQLRFAHLSNLNAQRRELGKAIDSDLKDINTLPVFPALKETRKAMAKRYAKYTGFSVGALGALGGASVASVKYLAPVAAKAAVNGVLGSYGFPIIA
ncbi:MAG: hypothetical protein K940chlam5_00811 [Candidatus Anoxychlamydiales bacterium]|nr:hypothetical protein [Candidatus Anoxychlamydiales bacterium]